MQRNLYLSLICFIVFVANGFAQGGSGTLQGKLIDKETGEPMPFVNVSVQNGTTPVAGGATNFDGEYSIKPIQPGTYTVVVSSVGYNTAQQTGVIINANKITFLNLELESGVNLDEVIITEYTRPLIDKDGGPSGTSVTREDIARLPGRSATSIAATAGGTQVNDDGEVSIRGAREENTFYYIDGIKVRGSTNLPKSAIEEVSVLTGGIPANFGDATGGIISITTRGASSTYFGGVDILTSGFRNEDGGGVGLDAYSQTQIEGVFSGPLIFKKDAEGNKERPILGFFLAANYRDLMDTRPSVIGNYRVKDDVLRNLQNNPTTFRINGITSGAGVFIGPDGNPIDASTILSPQVAGIYNSSFLRMDDIERVDARQNARSRAGSLTLKLDFNPTATTDVSLGGTFDYTSRNEYLYDYSLLNYQNNPELNSLTYRGFARFTQRFANPDNAEENSGGISNAYYSVMVDYTKFKQTRQDAVHKDNFFNYGYVGKFTTTQVPVYVFEPDGQNGPAFYQQGYGDIAVDFEADDTNADLSAVTRNLFDFYEANGYVVPNLNAVLASNALRNGDRPEDLYSIYRNSGFRNDAYDIFDNEQYRITGTGSADISGHALQIGFEFEQRIDRQFNLDPIGLWEVGRQELNSHILEQNFEQTTNAQNINGVWFYDYDRLVDLPNQSFFDRNVRTSLGLNPNGDDFIFIDELSPDQLSLDMFSADELFRGGSSSLVSYFGYDHAGNRISGRPSFDDFFTERDEFGNFTRPIGAFEPTYISGFIMDKFSFDDIIFNVGVRVDRYDANQQVLKDPYIVGDAYTVGSIPGGLLDLQNHPSNVGEDWAVYVNDIDNPTSIVGYRDEDQWYNAQGVPLDDPSILRTPNGIAPLLVDPGSELTSSAFRDYTPQVTIMPRIAFSFPISDEAVFFAHYDILTQRPTDFNRLNPIDYMFIQSRNNVVNNPNLLPTKTTDYELGFQQVLSKSSSLKISAFYRELSQMVQARQLVEAYPRSYITFDNIDFGTVKGLTFAYDLRRTGNVTLRTSYTMQFASATGSSSTSGVNLANSGQPQLRIISPTDQDQRHVIIGSLDYRYGSGNNYNGPVLGGKQILSNFGVNVLGNLGSGTPYSQQRQETAEANIAGGGTQLLEGMINGSRMPWQFRVDLQVDKSFNVYFGKKDGERGKPALLNVYVLVNNLLNTQNVIQVYRFTGNPDDDAYLTASQFQPGIESQVDPQSYRELYGLKVNDPGNYGLARTIQLGVKLDF